MRLKKVMSLVLSGVVAVSLVACGSASKTAEVGKKDDGNGKIVVGHWQMI